MKKITVVKFKIADNDDPWLYAAQPIWNWEQSEQGKWVMNHSTTTPEFNVFPCQDTYGYDVTILATLSDQDLTFFKLKWL
jgi:hypothetical protein